MFDHFMIREDQETTPNQFYWTLSAVILLISVIITAATVVYFRRTWSLSDIVCFTQQEVQNVFFNHLWLYTDAFTLILDHQTIKFGNVSLWNVVTGHFFDMKYQARSCGCVCVCGGEWAHCKLLQFASSYFNSN